MVPKPKPTTRTFTTHEPLRYAPTDAETTFQHGNLTWHVGMVDPMHARPPRKTVEIFWSVTMLEKTTQADGWFLGAYWAIPTGNEWQMQFEIGNIGGAVGLTRLELFSLHDDAAVPDVTIPIHKLVNAAKAIGRVVGDYQQVGSKPVTLRKSAPARSEMRTPPITDPEQMRRAFLAYTNPANQRRKLRAVAEAIGKGVKSAEAIIRLLKDDPYYGPKMKAETTTTKGGKK